MATAWGSSKEDTASALAGTKILDVSGVGAYASMVLADFGADVIRVAAPPSLGRRLTTGSRLDPHGQLDARRASAYNALHRGQRSVGLNLKTAAGGDVFRTLARDADVVLESFRPGVMDRLGIGYEELRKLNPNLVYCALSGYGQTGPFRTLPGHDINYIALGGLLGLTRRRGTPPVLPLNFGADFAGGALFAALSIVIALQARDRIGEGQYIDMSMTDGVLSLLTAAFIGYFADGEEIRPGEYALNGGAPWYDVYECSDGNWLALGCIEPYFFSDLCIALGLEDLIPYEFDSSQFDKIRECFGRVIASRAQSDWMETFLPLGIAVSPVLDMADIPIHEHIIAREMVVTMHSKYGPTRQIGVAPKLSRTPGIARGDPPEPGFNTRSILVGLGLDSGQIEELLKTGVAFEAADERSSMEIVQ